MSYSEWLGRQTRNAVRYLDTRPHGDASQHTEKVKRQATVVRGKGTASDFITYNVGDAYSTGTRANTKGSQIEIGPVPSTEYYGILTGFSKEGKYLLYRDLNPGSSDFTVECFFKAYDFSSQTIWEFVRTDAWVGLRFDSGYITFEVAGPIVLEFPETIEYGVETYCAISRNGYDFYGTLNSTTTYLGSLGFDFNSLDLSIGGDYYDEQLYSPFFGQISNFRYVKRALYTQAGTITIPKRPLQNVDDTELLLIAKQDAPFADSSNAQRVAEGVFPTWTAGTSDYGILNFINNGYLYYPYFGITGDFTIECFFKYSNPQSGEEYLWEIIGENDSLGLYIEDGYLAVTVNDEGDTSEITTPLINTWYHVAITRCGSDWYTSINGVTWKTSSLGSANLSNSSLYVGNSASGNDDYPFYSGSISNFRVSDYARYTTNFTVPTPPLSAEGARLLLLAKQSNPFGDSAGTNVPEGSCTWQPGPIRL